MSEWQPIETAPKDEWFLCCEYHGPEFYIIRPCVWVVNGWHTGGDEISPTHWKPIPEPPST